MIPDKWANPRAMWDERFSQAEPVYGDAPNLFLQSEAFRLKPGMKVLVPADGYGRNGIWLAKQGLQVHTVDLSAVGVERARKTAQAAGVNLRTEVADLAAWTWPAGEYDAVVSIFFHVPPEVRAKVHPSMLRALKPGGIVILQAFTPAQLHILREDFAGAEIVLLEEKVAHLEEGRLHSGAGAVVDAVLRRKAVAQ